MLTSEFCQIIALQNRAQGGESIIKLTLASISEERDKNIIVTETQLCVSNKPAIFLLMQGDRRENLPTGS